jgi:hypothetical protein
MFRDELDSEGVPNIERLIRQRFQTWLRKHVSLQILICTDSSFSFFSVQILMCVCVACARS